MTTRRVRVYCADRAPLAPDHDAAEAVLVSHGVIWATLPPRPLPADGGPQRALAVWHDVVDATCLEQGFLSVDVVSVDASTPNVGRLRAEFRDEHVHADEETRLFAAGGGVFWLRLRDDEVWAIRTVAGDLLSLPAGLCHGFDMGPSPSFTAIRFSRDAAGRVPQPTGSPRGPWPEHVDWGW